MLRNVTEEEGGIAANNLAFTVLHVCRLDLYFRLEIPLNNQTTATLSA